MAQYPEHYIQSLTQGPFPGLVDPWAEVGYYFRQIHAGFIGEALERLRIPLLQRGYIAAREASLQITQGREPDILIQHPDAKPLPSWDYASAAQSIHVEPGTAITWNRPELDAIFIRDEDGQLVTVLEVVSPSNKTDESTMHDYRLRRDRLLQQGVHTIEVDPTRSVKRLLEDTVVRTCAYHTAIYIAGDTPRILGNDALQPLRTFALPLANEVMPLETQDIYDHAYQQASVAAQIRNRKQYTAAHLPFPSLLTPKQHNDMTERLQAWLQVLDAPR